MSLSSIDVSLFFFLFLSLLLFLPPSLSVSLPLPVKSINTFSVKIFFLNRLVKQQNEVSHLSLLSPIKV